MISAKKHKDWIVVDVADNGLGIDDVAKEHLFDMFYSTSQSIADSRRGMGIGLALCKSIIQAHEGTLTVHDHLPTGAIFRFTLQSQEVEL
ncbi:ATP-binding protein [Solibacillus sp. MA9]|uniref:histidine kinase n=2 Tax=Solibacillus palustris TaxID=2908203 RepID=A0ABS9UHD5_9BACL|nr:ATP-binding protein [Solibacillus sp. MA9]